jgi:cell division septation protein DedD
MPTMVTFQAGRLALFTVLAGLATACSREQQDWRSAETANTAEAWQRFLEQHPDSELVNQARLRIAQLEAQRDFQYADRQGTVEAYRDFLTRHPSGKWSEQARIRIEGFSLGSAPRIAPPTPEEAAAFTVAGVRALRLAAAAVPVAATEPEVIPVGMVPVPTDDAERQAGGGRAIPGEAAQAAPDLEIKPVSANDPAQAGYGVQLGAFGSEASADREWRRLQGRFGAELGSLSPRIVLAESDSRQFYRLQAPASGEAEARAICDSLREQAQPCVPVLSR